MTPKLFLRSSLVAKSRKERFIQRCVSFPSCLSTIRAQFTNRSWLQWTGCLTIRHSRDSMMKGYTVPSMFRPSFVRSMRRISTRLMQAESYWTDKFQNVMRKNSFGKLKIKLIKFSICSMMVCHWPLLKKIFKDGMFHSKLRSLLLINETKKIYWMSLQQWVT